MAKNNQHSAHLQQRLDAYRKEYEQVRARLQEVGFIFKGSITLRRLSCGHPNCRCRDSKKRHGPYYQISWKQKAKTVSRFLPAHIVPLYREWIANAARLTLILRELQEISHKAADSIQAAEIKHSSTKKSPTARKKAR
jgi:predicted transcriptional regulator